VIFIIGGNPLERTILDYCREKGINEDTIQDTIAEGHKGILIAESVSPEPVYGGRENDLWMGRH
jgi:nitrogenase subunit NifH